MRPSRLFLLVASVGSLLHAVFAAPYSFIPSDERSFLMDPNRTSVRPVLNWMLDISRPLVGIWENWPHPSSWLVILTLGTFLSSFSVMRMTYFFTAQKFPSLLAGLFFLFSHWAGAYFYWATYSPFGAGVFLFSLFLVMNSAAQETTQDRAALICAGILQGLLFWCIPNGTLTLGLLQIGLFAFLRDRSREAKHGLVTKHELVKPSLIFLLPALIIICIGMIWSWDSLLFHWRDNMNSYKTLQGNLAQRYYNTSSFTPLGSFFGVSAAHSAPLTLFLGAGLFLTVFFKNKSLSICAFLFALHSLLVDLLPFTKLGRTQFTVFPLFVALGSTGMILWSTEKKKFRPVLRPILLAIFLACICANVAQTVSTRFSKRGLSEMAKNIPVGDRIYVLQPDLHAWHFQEALRRPLHVLNGVTLPPERGWLIVGPHGKASGRTVLRNSAVSDWLFQEDLLLQNGWKAVGSAPFYAYNKAFSMEAELSQTLFFKGYFDELPLTQLGVTLYRTF
jgi:hypothetical protein